MDRQAILQRMEEILSDLNEQFESLKNHPGRADQLEMELFEANIKFLDNHTQILKRLNQAAPVEPVPVETSLPEQEEKQVIAVLEEPALEEEAEELEETPAEEPVWVHEERMVVENQVVVAEVPPVKEEQPVAPAAGIAAVKPSINDLLAGQTSAKLADKLGQEPLKDLKTAISLNEKLVFVKDLFSGYSLAYAEAIEVLNKLESFEAADEYLKINYVAQHKWSDKQSTADRFYELLNRRFAK